MLTRFITALALFACASTATETTAEAEQYPHQRSYHDPHSAPRKSFGGKRGRSSVRGGHHGQDYHVPEPKVSGIKHVVRSTYRPRDVYATAIVDKYWQYNGPSEETIVASCEFDFFGNSYGSGRMELSQKPHGDNTLFDGVFQGLKPGIHAIKVHEKGDLSYGCESVGDVYNPFGSYRGHSHEDIMERRVGDIEQIQGRFDTNAEYKNRDAFVQLSGPLSVVGRSLVVYEREDDHDETEHAERKTREGRERTGHGHRIGCCVIGLAKGEKPKIKY